MRWYQIVIIILAAVVVAIGGITFGFHIDHIKVEGTEIYTAEEITNSVFTRKYSDNELMFFFYEKIYGINKLPFVEDIDVSFDNRNTVTLHVYDKSISGCIKYMGKYVYFDKDGIVLQSMDEKRTEVPVVTGISFGTFTVGKAFNVKDASLFSTIMNLSQLISHYDINVDRIHIGSGQIIVYSGAIQVLLPKKDMYDDEMSALSSVLETTAKEKLSGTIDMRKFKHGETITLQPAEHGKSEK